MMRQPIFTEEEARQVIERTAELQKIEFPAEFNFTDPVSKYDLAEVLSDAGFYHFNIEQALQEFESKRRNSTITDTHLIEEAEITTFAEQEIIWREIISELKCRLQGNPSVQSNNTNPKTWTFTERSGRETKLKLEPLESKIRLTLIRQIGFAHPYLESIISGGLIALIVFGYLTVFMNYTFITNSAVFLCILALLPLLIRKLTLHRRKNMQQKFQLLTEHVLGQIPRIKVEEYSTENQATTESDQLRDFNETASIWSAPKRRFPGIKS